LTESPPVGSRLPAPERRRQLLVVALEVFAAHGYHGTSMNEVAEAAGVTKPVLYQHFRSKRALFLELLEDVGVRLEAAIVKSTAEAVGPHQQVQAGFRTYFQWVASEQAAFTVLFGGVTRGDAQFSETARRVEATIAEAVAALIDVEGLDTVQRRVLAHGVVGIAESTSRHWMAHELDLDPEVLAAQSADLAWAGLRGIRHP
jgi:AcrR family transcriptional regulator